MGVLPAHTGHSVPHLHLEWYNLIPFITLVSMQCFRNLVQPILGVTNVERRREKGEGTIYSDHYALPAMLKGIPNSNLKSCTNLVRLFILSIMLVPTKNVGPTIR